MDSKKFPKGYPKDEESACVNPRCRSTLRRRDGDGWITCVACWWKEHEESGTVREPGLGGEG